MTGTKDQTSSLPVGAIAGGSGAAVVVVLAIIIVAVVTRRYKLRGMQIIDSYSLL